MSFKIQKPKPTPKYTEEEIKKVFDRIVAPKTAIEPISVRKILYRRNKDILALHTNFKYEVGETYTVDNFLKEEFERVKDDINRNRNSCDYFLHLMAMLEDLLYEMRGIQNPATLEQQVLDALDAVCVGFHSWRERGAENLGNNELLCGFEIPAGALYLENETDYVSNQIKFVSIIAESK